MAHKKAGGSVKNGRDSVGQRLGVKAGDGQSVTAGSITVVGPEAYKPPSSTADFT